MGRPPEKQTNRNYYQRVQRMSYLFSQLWLCLFVSSLLGGLIGWFIRGDNKSKLYEIENRWKSRFAELEFSNQALLDRLKQGGAIENKYKNIQSRLNRMNKAAELANEELKFKQTSMSKLEKELLISNSRLVDQETQINELVAQLSDIEQLQKNQEDSQLETLSNSHRTDPEQQDKKSVNKKTSNAKIAISQDCEKISRELAEKKEHCQLIKKDYDDLVKKTDGYKASLIDAESKLRITTEMLNEQCKESTESYKQELDDLRAELYQAKELLSKQQDEE